MQRGCLQGSPFLIHLSHCVLSLVLLGASDQVVVWKKDGWYLFGEPLSGAEGVKSEFCSGYSLGDLLSSTGIMVSSCAVRKGGMVAVMDGWIWSRKLAQEHGRGATGRKGNPRNVVARDSGEDSGKFPYPPGPHQLCETHGFC